MTDRTINRLIFTRRAAVVALLGFASGIPLALSDSTLQAWLTVANLDVSTIGLFSLVGLPYTIKFLWAPIIDRFDLKFIGRRRDWIFLSQIMLSFTLFSLGSRVIENDSLAFVGLLAFLVAFISATQDIAVDAYRAEVLKAEERGFGAALSVTGYRMAMLVSGAGALMLADVIGFNKTYMIMSLIMFICSLINFFSPDICRPDFKEQSIQALVLEPFKSFFSKEAAFALLGIIFLYKLGDAFAGRLTTTFLIRGLGFSLTDVGAVNKGLGLMASIIGGLYGGVLMYRLGLYRSLVLFGWLQALTNLGFYVLSIMGASYVGLVAVIGLENLAGGMGTAAFVALLMSVCDRRYTATQFAILSAVASLGRVFAGPPSGFLVENLGWSTFFVLTVVISLPVIYLLAQFRRVVEDHDRSEPI